MTHAHYIMLCYVVLHHIILCHKKLLPSPICSAGIVGRQLTLTKRSSTMPRLSHSLSRGLSKQPTFASRHFEEALSPTDAVSLRRRSVSMGQTPMSRVGLLRLRSRGLEASRDIRYACASHAVLCLLCCCEIQTSCQAPEVLQSLLCCLSSWLCCACCAVLCCAVLCCLSS